MFENILFLNPILWFLSFIFWMIVLFFVYKTKKFKTNFKFFEDLESVFWKSSFYFKWFLSFIFVLILLFSLIIANPNIKDKSQKVKKNWIDIVLVLDLSYSMTAEDIKPNRLEMAKQVISDFVWKLKTDRIWLIVFSWKPFTSIPLTFDYTFVKDNVEKININTINQNYQYLQWTAIWDGLLYWANLFKNDSKDREKVIVLLTDWEANRWIEPIQAVRYMKDKNIKIHTVWIWGFEDTYVKIQNAFWNQKIAIWWIDEKTLKSIASLTSGEYYRASDNDTFSKLFEKLNLLEKKDIEVEEYVVFLPYYKPFIYLLILFFTMFLWFNFYYYLKN